MNHKQAAKKRWRSVRNARAAKIRNLREWRFKLISRHETPFGTVRYMVHPLFAQHNEATTAVIDISQIKYPA